MKQLVLVKPPNDLGPEHHSLFGLLCLAGHVRAYGARVQIINADADSRWKEHLQAKASKDVLVGIQAMTTEVAGAIEASDIAHACGAEVIWGGIHAQVFPKQVVEDDSVDYVCTGDGEGTLEGFTVGRAIENIPNLMSKRGFTFRQDDEPAYLCSPAYDLLEDDSSPWLNHKRWQAQASRGCPQSCRFCQNPILGNRKWRTKYPVQIVRELDWIQKVGGEFVEFVDDNPFVKPSYMNDVADKILEWRIVIEWAANCRADYISHGRIDRDYLEHLYKAGLRTLGIGAESGSQRILDLIQKDMKVSDLLDAATTIGDVGLDSSFSFFFGIKGETLDDVRETITLFDELKEVMPMLRIGVNIYTPYPGCSLSEGLVNEPDTLRGWLMPEVRRVYSDRFAGKPWHENPEFYKKLAYACGLVYSPASRYSPSLLDFSARKAAWKWIHNI